MNAFWKSLGQKSLGQWIPAFVFAALLAGAFAIPAAAQDQYQGQYQQDDDPPGIAARLSFVQGSVSFQPAGEDEWVEAVPNRPMTVDDKLWTDQNSRSEIALGATSIYLSSNTGVSFLNLDDRTTQIQLSAGTIDVRVRQLDQDEVVEIDTANQAFNIYQPGRYRIEASDNGDFTVVTVREGDGQSTGNGQTYSVHAGQRATFTGTDQLNAELDQIDQPDAFDSWSDGRDRRYTSSRSAQYCSREMVGYEDLDAYGDWQAQSEYGHVWYPRVAAGWAPYRDGHWAWIDPWGWTWVDDSPWGYAPFHYGRWSNFGGRWGWVPGPVAVRPVYAPALVVFVGGAGFGIGGNVGWFPLGPREVYVPSYRVSERYVQRVNVSNTVVNQTTITNVYNTTIINKTTTINNVTYVNRNVNGAVTAVPQRTFATAQPVARAVVKVDARQLAAGSVGARAQVAPQREAVLGAHSNTAGRVAAPPKAVVNRQVIARTQPAPQAASFASKQQAFAKNPGQAVQRKESQQLRASNAPAPAAVKIVKPTQPATPPAAKPGSQPGRPGNQPAGQPGNQPANQPNANQPGNRPGNPPAGNDRPGANQPGNQPGNKPNRPDVNRPENNQPNRPENGRPNQPQPTQPNDARPNAQPNNARPNDDRPEANQPNRSQPNNSQPNNPNNRPDNNRPDNNRPNSNRPENQPERPGANQPDSNRPNPNRPQPNRPDNQPDNPRPQPNSPANRPNNQPDDSRPQPNNRPDNRPQPNRPDDQPDRTNRNDDSRQPGNRPEANAPADRPRANRPQPNRPDATPAQRDDRPPQTRDDAQQRRQQAQKPPAKTQKQKDQEEKQREQEEKKREQEEKKPQ